MNIFQKYSTSDNSTDDDMDYWKSIIYGTEGFGKSCEKALALYKKLGFYDYKTTMIQDLY